MSPTENPADGYVSPQAIVDDPRLGYEHKLELLQAWEKDAELLSRAEEENMGGPQRSRLREVKLALAQLQRTPLSTSG